MERRSTIASALAILLVSLAAGRPGSSASSGEFPKGLGADEAREQELRAAAEKLVALVGAEKPDWPAALETVRAARKLAAGLAAKAAGKEAVGEPDVPDVSVGAGLKPAHAAKVPVAFPGGVRADDVRSRWREQLGYAARSAVGLLDGDVKYIEEWCGRPGYQKPERRVPAMVAILREVERAALLLSRPQEEVEFKKGKELFADDFSKGAGNWLSFGQCVASNEGDAFRLRDEKVAHPDAMMWTRQEFDGDFVAEFRFTPHTAGTRAGALFTVCGRPRPGKELAVCVGETMDTYNYGIDGYHFSMHRGTTGLGNVRRVGPGLKLLTSGRDPCPEPGREYKVAVGKAGAAIFLMVDGKLVHHYLDAATWGPVLSGGHIGIRHWAGLDASYRDFRVFRLEAAK